MIPYANRYTATVRGRATKAVTCEECRLEYLYTLERTASGEGTSLLFLDNDGAAARAEDGAVRAVEGELADAVDVVPCPRCGRVQVHMFAQAWRDKVGWCGVAAMWAGGAAVIAGVSAFAFDGEVPGGGDLRQVVFWSRVVAGGGVAVAVGLLGYTYWAKQTYDPNDAPFAERFRLGRERATPVQEAEELVKLVPAYRPR